MRRRRTTRRAQRRGSLTRNEAQPDSQNPDNSSSIVPLYSNTVFPNTFPKIVLRNIISYLDSNSALAFSRVSKRVNRLVELGYPWEDVCRSFGIPRCLPCQHNPNDLWIDTCTDHTHTWRRAFVRQKAIEKKWLTGQIDVKQVIFQEESQIYGINWKQPNIAYDRWLISWQMWDDIEIMDMKTPGSVKCVIKRRGWKPCNLIVLPIPNEPAQLYIMNLTGHIYVYKLDGEEFPCVWEFHPHLTFFRAFAISTSSSNPDVPDERCLFVTGLRHARIWDARNKRHLRTLSGSTHLYCAAAFCDEHIVVALTSGHFRIFKMDGTHVRTVYRDGITNQLHFDGTWLVSRDFNGVGIWNLETRQYISYDLRLLKYKIYMKSGEIIYAEGKTLKAIKFKAGVRESIIEGSTLGIVGFDVCRDLVITVTEDCKVRVRDRNKPGTSRIIGNFPRQTIYLANLYFMPSTGHAFADFRNPGCEMGCYFLLPK